MSRLSFRFLWLWSNRVFFIKTEFFPKIVNGWRQLTNFAKSFILDVWLAPECISVKIHPVILILSWRRPPSYRKQSIDLLCKSMDWFLCDRDFDFYVKSGWSLGCWVVHFQNLPKIKTVENTEHKNLFFRVSPFRLTREDAEKLLSSAQKGSYILSSDVTGERFLSVR